MTNFKVVLDTDTLSFYLRKVPKVLLEAQNYLQHNPFFTFSLITRFELLRGMKARKAVVQTSDFEIFCLNNEVLEIDDPVIVKAADIYADLHRRGQLIGDADIIIAATALEYNLAVVTNNENHFNRIGGLQVLNWNK